MKIIAYLNKVLAAYYCGKTVFTQDLPPTSPAKPFMVREVEIDNDVDMVELRLNGAAHDEFLTTWWEKELPPVAPGPIQPPDAATCKRHGLLYHDGSPAAPTFCGTSTVFAGAAKPDDPVYALFHYGTNNLVILELRNGEWSKIELEQVENLYGLMWKMSVMVQGLLPSGGTLTL